MGCGQSKSGGGPRRKVATADTHAAWSPAPAGALRSYLGRCLSFPCYPCLFPYAVFSQCDATVENAQWWRKTFAGVGLAIGALGHSYIWRRWGSAGSVPSSRKHWLAHLGLLFTWDHPHAWLAYFSHQLVEIFAVNRKSNRLEEGKLHGPRVLVVGNGPSAVEGAKYGDEINEFDEVVRFNNFQCKVSGLEKWVGTKTTVHFSDGDLYPTYKEYYVPGATVMLSLFADRFIVAGSYLVLRGGADLQTELTNRFLMDPETNWIDKASIDRLKADLCLSGVKHPTSGMLAIDYFIRKEGVQLPVYIHGFDFFQRAKMHYYDEAEPLYERINNKIGVNLHEPRKEKLYVERLIAEGKVKFLKDRHS